MKKRLASLALLLILCLLLALPALADSARELPLVCDTSGILTEEQAEELNAKAEAYSRQYSCAFTYRRVPGKTPGTLWSYYIFLHICLIYWMYSTLIVETAGLTLSSLLPSQVSVPSTKPWNSLS